MDFKFYELLIFAPLILNSLIINSLYIILCIYGLKKFKNNLFIVNIVIIVCKFITGVIDSISFYYFKIFNFSMPHVGIIKSLFYFLGSVFSIAFIVILIIIMMQIAKNYGCREQS